MGPSPSQVDDGFLVAVVPTVAAVTRLAGAYDKVTAREPNPSAESRGMAEIADQPRFRHGPWTAPVEDAHQMAALLLVAGFDHLRGYARLFTAMPVPVYTHLVVARATLEAFGWGRWLADPAISVEVRVKRGRVHQFDDAKQRRRFPDQDMRDFGQMIHRRVNEGADAAGWRVVNNPKRPDRESVGGEMLPWPTDVISGVLGPRDQVIDQLGAVLWCALSGVSHSVRYALLSAVGTFGPLPGSPFEARTAPLETKAATVALVGVTLLRAALTAGGAYLDLYGWVTDEWRAVVEETEQHIAAVSRATSSD